MLENLKEWSRIINRDVHAIYLASRDSRVPWHAKALGIAVAAYALSPIDLIPDFIPVLGYLDDLIIVPLGIALVVRLIPTEVMTELRARTAAAQNHPVSLAGAAAVVTTWLTALGLSSWLGYPYFAST